MTRPARVVLLQPPLRNLVAGAVPQFVDSNRGHLPVMGLLYVHSAIERSGHDVAFLDADLEGWTHEAAAAEALKRDPDVVGMQATSFTLPDACLMARAVKERNPGVKVMIGGPHPSIYPKETAALPYVDFAFAGEAEHAIGEFLDAFDDEDARLRVPGVAGDGGDGPVFTPATGLIEDMDTVPFPARAAGPYTRYTSVLARRNPVTVMITSRGCPFDCVFCNRMGRRYRWHSSGYVLREFDSIAELGIPEVFIHDDTFSIRKDRVREICRGLIDRGHDIVWEARTRVDCVDRELLALMRRAGCCRLSFGVESGSPEVLEKMRKGIDLDRVVEVFGWCRAEGIITLADFMFGNLGEKRDDIERTLEFVRKVDPDYAQFSICSPYPGTPLYEIGLERGLLATDVWREFAADPLHEFHSPVWTEHFSEEELVRMSTEAYSRFYMRPRFLVRQMGRVRSIRQFMMLVRAAFGMALSRILKLTGDRRTRAS